MIGIITNRNFKKLCNENDWGKEEENLSLCEGRIIDIQNKTNSITENLKIPQNLTITNELMKLSLEISNKRDLMYKKFKSYFSNIIKEGENKEIW